MEKRDIELIQKYSPTDDVLNALYQEHLDFEKELEELENETPVTPEVEMKIRSIKKKKLMGRDRIEGILRKYRASEK